MLWERRKKSAKIFQNYVLYSTFFSYLVGIVFTTSAGEYWLTLFDSFGATGLTFIAFTGIRQI
jgi:hypothetical protein